VIYPLLDKILATLSPLALFSIGLQLRISDWRLEKRELFWGLWYKLLIAPLFIYLFVVILGDKTIIGEISVIQSAMPTHITSSLIAIQYGLNPRFCYLMVGIGILFCFITSAFWYFIM
jgi:predicted permease